MENASKAILIAGAVLIVLIVIGIAVVFVSKSNIITKIFSDDLSEEEIANHNAMFSMYDGEISGTQVITLINTVTANNDKSDIKMKVSVLGAGDVDENLGFNAGIVITRISKTHIYKAKIIYDEKGIISEINVGW